MKFAPLFALTTFILFDSCQSRNNSIDHYLDNSIIEDSLNVPVDSNQVYFPYKIFEDTSNFVGSDTFLVVWYSEHLRAMQEPLLFNRKTDKEIYRFLWLRTFHNPVVIRIEKDNESYSLSWKLCDGAGGYEPGNMIVDKSKQINEDTWNQFLSIIRKMDYWNTSTVEDGISGEDGAQWILEGVDQNRYHVLDCWCGGKVYESGIFLLGLTDLNIKKEDIY